VSSKSCNRMLHRKKSSVKSAGVGCPDNGMFFAADEIPRPHDALCGRIDIKALAREGELDMDANALQGQWQRVRGDIRSKWGKLTNDDLDQIAGSKDKLVGTLQERYGYMWDEAREMVDRYLDEYSEGGLRSKISSVMSKDNFQKIGDTVSDVVSKDSLQRMGNDVVDCIRRYPVSALLIGLGIGYLLARRPDWHRD
jgi:uncharacterized protein YjbJ (UPF0337 family)